MGPQYDNPYNTMRAVGVEGAGNSQDTEQDSPLDLTTQPEFNPIPIPCYHPGKLLPDGMRFAKPEVVCTIDLTDDSNTAGTSNQDAEMKTEPHKSVKKHETNDNDQSDGDGGLKSDAKRVLKRVLCGHRTGPMYNNPFKIVEALRKYAADSDTETPLDFTYTRLQKLYARFNIKVIWQPNSRRPRPISYWDTDLNGRRRLQAFANRQPQGRPTAVIEPTLRLPSSPSISDSELSFDIFNILGGEELLSPNQPNDNPEGPDENVIQPMVEDDAGIEFQDNS